MRFVLATSHYAGLGFALRPQDEGHEVVVGYRGIENRRAAESYDVVGNGLVNKAPLRDLIEERARDRDAYWIWDENRSVEENELLRGDGYRVFGGGRYADRMEHARR